MAISARKMTALFMARDYSCQLSVVPARQPTTDNRQPITDNRYGPRARYRMAISQTSDRCVGVGGRIRIGLRTRHRREGIGGLAALVGGLSRRPPAKTSRREHSGFRLL